MGQFVNGPNLNNMTQLALVTLLALGAGTVYGKPRSSGRTTESTTFGDWSPDYTTESTTFGDWSPDYTTENYSGDWSPDYTTEDYPWDNPNDWYTTGSPDWPSTSDVQNNWWPKTKSPEP